MACWGKLQKYSEMLSYLESSSMSTLIPEHSGRISSIKNIPFPMKLLLFPMKLISYSLKVLYGLISSRKMSSSASWLSTTISCDRRCFSSRTPCGIFSSFIQRACCLIHQNNGRYGEASLPLSWWRHQIETFSALLALCAGNSPVTGEFPAQRPVTRSFDLRLNKQLSKQWWGWWFDTPSRPLWRHCNDVQVSSARGLCPLWTHWTIGYHLD